MLIYRKPSRLDKQYCMTIAGQTIAVSCRLLYSLFVLAGTRLNELEY